MSMEFDGVENDQKRLGFEKLSVKLVFLDIKCSLKKTRKSHNFDKNPNLFIESVTFSSKHIMWPDKETVICPMNK